MAPTKDHTERESSVRVYQIPIYAGYQSTRELVAVTIKQVIGQLKEFLKPVFESGRKLMVYGEASRALSQYVLHSRARMMGFFHCSQTFEATSFVSR
jgi:hypothetical protein